VSVGFVFPGQGSQEVGMGQAIAQAFAVARETFDLADQALVEDGVKLSDLCFHGPLETLTLTENTQPAVLATSIACFRALQSRAPSVRPVLMAGHSLGEYAALVATGALDFQRTVGLVRLRGRAMQQAVPAGTGAMAALIGIDAQIAAELCEQVRAEFQGKIVQPANYNAPGQLVIAGHAEAVQRVSQLVSDRRGRSIALNVSAPFHCELMRSAAERLAQALESMPIGSMICPVVANVDAQAHTEPEKVRTLLVEQVAGAVRWEQCVRTMVDAGVDTFVEIGPGKVLSGLIRRIHRGATVHSVSDPGTLEATARALGG
jgi:[acyl-carrier-protein] S-malonyltransferase